jgi:hypothetical protein
MDIVVWPRSMGLGKYEAAFRENEIICSDRGESKKSQIFPSSQKLIFRVFFVYLGCC